jgi:cell division septation protein DedD
MSNKHVIVVFFIGVALLLGAFWAGLKVTKQDASAGGSANEVGQNAPDDRSAKTQQKTTPPQLTEQAGAPEGRYIVVVRQYATAEAASQFMNEFRRDPQHRSAYTQPPNAQNPFYRVNIGPYTTREQAEQTMNDLAAQGMKGVMVEPWTQK